MLGMTTASKAGKDVVELSIAGAAGRMGRRLVAQAKEIEGVKLACAFEQPDHPAIGTDSGELAGIGANQVPITGGPSVKADVIIDFTTPEAMRRLLVLGAQEDISVVVGTTGLTPDDHAAIDDAAESIAVVQSPNMSLGVNLLFALAARTARQLGDDYDIEILEAHHRFKKDAPSGTAMGVAHAICEATGKDPSTDLVFTRHGHDEVRQEGKITMQTLRMGDTVGEHTAYFAALGERLELTHRATTRDTFARGAIRAARWVVQQPPGRYTMGDVLGLEED